MSDDIRTELADLRDVVVAGFIRVDRYFELQQAQHLELSGKVDAVIVRLDGLTEGVDTLTERVDTLTERVDTLAARVDTLTGRMDRVEARLSSLEHGLRAFRDWVTGEFADVRRELRLLREETAERDDALRGEVLALSRRVDRLEQRFDQPMEQG